MRLIQFANAFSIVINLHSLGVGGVRSRPSVPYGANFMLITQFKLLYVPLKILAFTFLFYFSSTDDV